MKWEQLNLGSGGLLWGDFINFDKNHHKRGEMHTDVVGDIMALPFTKGKFKSIICIHTVEHFYKTDVITILKDCYDLLVPGGSLIMEGPCILGCFQMYVLKQDNVSRFIDFIYGGEDNRLKYGNEYAHKSGWTGDLLAQEMQRIGFEVIVKTIGQHHGMGYRDFRVEGRK